MSTATGVVDTPRVVASPGDSFKIVRTQFNADRSGCLVLENGWHLNFEAEDRLAVRKLYGARIVLTSSTILLGDALKAVRIADRVTPKRIRWVGSPADWFGQKWEPII